MDLLASTCRIRAKTSPLREEVLEAYVSPGFRLAEILSPEGKYFVVADGQEVKDPHSFVVGTDTREIGIVGRPDGAETAYAVFAAVATFTGSVVVGAIVANLVYFLPYALFAYTLVTVATLDLPKNQQSGPPQKLNSLTGSKNRFNPYGALPVLYGKRRFFPALAANPYTELLGKDQYLNMLFLVSLGEVVVSEPRLGDNDLDDYENVELESYYGTLPDWYDIAESFPNIDLDDPAASSTPDISWTATTTADSEFIGVDLVLPVGLMYTNSKAERRPAKLLLFVDYKLSTDADTPWNWRSVRLDDWDVTTAGSNQVLGAPAFGSNTGELWPANADFVLPRDGGLGYSLNLTTTISSIATEGGNPGYSIVTLAQGFWHMGEELTYVLHKSGVDKLVEAVSTALEHETQWRILTTDAASFNVGDTVDVRLPLEDKAFLLWEQNINPFRVGLKWQPPAPGQYDVRITRAYLSQQDPYTAWYIKDPDSPTAQTELAKYQATLTFGVLRSYTSRQAVSLDQAKYPATFLRLRLRANDQLNGAVDNFSILGERKLRMWNGTNWSAAAVTRSPAAAALDMLINPGINQKAIFDPADPLNPNTTTARTLQDEAIDLASFLAWDQGLITDEGFTYDEVIDYNASVLSSLRRAASVAWAGISVSEGRFKVLTEEAGGVVRQLFTPKNYWDFTGEKTFFDPPHAIKIEFDSEDADNSQDSIIVYDDGYNATGAYGNAAAYAYSSGAAAPSAATSDVVLSPSGTGDFLEGDIIKFFGIDREYRVRAWNAGTRTLTINPGLQEAPSFGAVVSTVPAKAATKFETVRMPGLTNADNAWKHGRRLLASTKLRPEIYRFKVGIESILVERGDIANLQADAGLIGLGGGRIVAKQDLGGGGAWFVTLDEPIQTQIGDQHRLIVRRSTATPAVVDQVFGVQSTTPGSFTTVWFVSGTEPGNWNVGDYAAVGVQGIIDRKVKVLSIDPGEDQSATITVVDENPAIYTAHVMTIPAYDPGVTQPPDPTQITPAKPVITSVKTHPYLAEIADGGGRLYRVGITYRRGSEYDLFTSLTALLRYRAISAEGESPAFYGAWQSMTDPKASGSFVVPVQNTQRYEFQVQLIPNNGAPSSLWSDAVLYTINIGTLTLETITGLAVAGTDGGFQVTIDIGDMTSSDVDHFELLHNSSASWTGAVSEIVPAPGRLDGFDDISYFLRSETAQTRYFWVRWGDIYGNNSPYFPSTAGAGISATCTAPASPDDAIVGQLTVPVDIVASASDGTGYSLTNTGGTFQVREGAALVDTGSLTFSVVGDATKNGLTIAINGSGVYSLSGASWTSDVESFMLRAVYGSVTIDLPYRISKVRAGAEGAEGPPGASGAATLAIRRNYLNFTTSGIDGYLFVHGFDSNGDPTDAGGVMVWDGDVRTVSRATLAYVSGFNPAQPRDGWILHDFAYADFFPASLLGGVVNRNMALVRRTRAGWQYYSQNFTPGFGWQSFTPTATMAIIGSYAYDGTTITQAILLGGGISPAAIPVGESEKVQPGDIDTGAITGVANFASGLSPIGVVTWGSPPVTGTHTGPSLVLNTTDLKVYRLVSNTPQVWTREVDGQDLKANSIYAGVIRAGIISATELASQAVTASKLAVIARGAALNRNPRMDDLGAWKTNLAFTTDLPTNIYSVVSSPSTPNVGPSLRVEGLAPGEFRAFFSEVIDIDPQKTYRISLWVRKVQGTTWTYPLVAFLDAAGVNIPGSNAGVPSGATGWAGLGTYHYFGISGVQAPGTWTKYELTFGPKGTATLPTVAQARKVQVGAIALYTNAGQVDAGIVEFQEFRLEEVLQGTLIEDGSITTNKMLANSIHADRLLAGTISSDKIEAGSIQADRLRLGVGNLLEDASFELATAGQRPKWSFPGVSNVGVVATSGGIGGGKFARMTATATGAGFATMYSNFIPVKPGEKYRLTCQYRTSGTVAGNLGSGDTAPLVIWWYDSGGGLVSPFASIVGPTVTAEAASFTLADSGVITIPAGIYSIRIQPITYLTAATLDVDDYQLVRLVDRQLVVDGEIVAGKLSADAVQAGNVAANAITSREVTAGAITVDKLRVGSVNLVEDGNFEFGGSTWAKTNAVVQSSIVYGGTQALRIDSFGNTSSPLIAIVPSGKLKVSIRYRTSGTGFGNIDAYTVGSVTFYSADRTTAVSVYTPNSKNTAYGTWQQDTYEVPVPATAYYCRIGFTNGVPGGSVYIDDVSLINLVTGSGLEADLVMGSIIRTAGGTDPRVQLDNTDRPLWIGSGSKTDGNAQLYYNRPSNKLVFKGTLEAAYFSTGPEKVLRIATNEAAGEFAPYYDVEVDSYFDDFLLEPNINYNYNRCTVAFLVASSSTDSNRLQAWDQPFLIEWESVLQNIFLSVSKTVDVKLQYRYRVSGIDGPWTDFDAASWVMTGLSLAGNRSRALNLCSYVKATAPFQTIEFRGVYVAADSGSIRAQVSKMRRTINNTGNWGRTSGVITLANGYSVFL